MSKKINPYETLGVKDSDTKEQIKNAYRKKSKKAHPDAGGDPKEFDTINQAYRLLVNDESRARYDSGEDPEKILNSKFKRDAEIEKLIADMFLNLVQGVDEEGKEFDVDFTDVFASIKKNLSTAVTGVDQMMKEEKRRIKKLQKSQKRITSKRKNPFFDKVINGTVQKIERNIALMEGKKKDFQDALQFMEDFSYQVDKREAAPMPQFLTFNINVGGF